MNVHMLKVLTSNLLLGEEFKALKVKGSLRAAEDRARCRCNHANTGGSSPPEWEMKLRAAAGFGRFCFWFPFNSMTLHGSI